MVQAVVREGVRPYKEIPGVESVVRITGLNEAERGVLKAKLQIWLQRVISENAPCPTYFACWVEYPEHPTWIDVFVPDLRPERGADGVHEVLVYL